MNQAVRTFYEMIIAIIIQMIVYGIVGMILSGQYIRFPLGILIGGSIAIGLLRHMMRSIDAALDLDSETAKKYGRRQALLRFTFMGLALYAAFCFQDYINPWGVFVGVLSLKFSAYLQPVIHRLIQIIYKKRREKSK